jgi:hypothetical protein
MSSSVIFDWAITLFGGGSDIYRTTEPEFRFSSANFWTLDWTSSQVPVQTWVQNWTAVPQLGHTYVHQVHSANVHIGLGFKTGTGKPTVPDKQVPRVWVWYPIWHTQAKLCTHGAVSRVRVGIFEGCACTSMPANEPQSLRFKTSQQLANIASDSSCLWAFLDGTLGSSDTNTTLITLAVSGRRTASHTVSWNVLYNSSVHQKIGSTTLNSTLSTTLYQQWKKWKGSWTKCHRKILHDNIQGQFQFNIYFCFNSHLVNIVGNPWVFLAVPVPIPAMRVWVCLQVSLFVPGVYPYPYPWWVTRGFA